MAVTTFRKQIAESTHTRVAARALGWQVGTGRVHQGDTDDAHAETEP